MIECLSEDFELQICKVRNVQSPTKAWDAAGWDFYIPEDLTVFDFAENYKMYLDDNVILDKKSTYIVPLVFHITSEGVTGESIAKLALNYDAEKDAWIFSVVHRGDSDKDEYTLITDEENGYIKYLKEKGTYIKKIDILPHGSINIPAGIHLKLPENILLKAENKSGIGAKRRLSFLASVIDPDYEGEVHLNLINESDLGVSINAGEKIIQMLPMFKPCNTEIKLFKTLKSLFGKSKSNRGAGRFWLFRNEVIKLLLMILEFADSKVNNLIGQDPMSQQIQNKEKIMSEEIKVEKKSWFNRVWSFTLGLVIGVAGVFGIKQPQINAIKADAEKAYTEVTAAVEAVKNKDYAGAIESGKNAATTLQTITGEVKEVAEIAKDTAEQYKDAVLELKAAVDAKDWKAALTSGTALLGKITENVPAENLTGKPKEIYDIATQVVNDINEQKYDPVIDLVTKLANLFKKAEAETPVEAPAEAPAEK